MDIYTLLQNNNIIASVPPTRIWGVGDVGTGDFGFFIFYMRALFTITNLTKLQMTTLGLTLSVFVVALSILFILPFFTFFSIFYANTPSFTL